MALPPHPDRDAQPGRLVPAGSRVASPGANDAAHRPAWRRARVLLPLGLAAGLLIGCAVVAGGAVVAGATEMPPLRGTTWVQVPLEGVLPAPAAPGPRTPQLRLDPQEPRVSGHTGCNRLTGGFTLEGSALRFGQAATTRMACLPERDNEPGFLRAFNAVRGWRIEGRVLLLQDARGRTVMRLQAAP
jgi:heat shock protein HslJ